MGKKKGKDRKKKRGSRGKGGRLSSMRGGMKSFVGTGPKNKKKESTLSKVIWYLILAGAIAFVVYYRFIRR